MPTVSFILLLLVVVVVVSVVVVDSTTTTTSADGPPVIDIGALMNPPSTPNQAWMRELSTILQQMDSAFREHGVFLVTNHGLSLEQIDNGFDAAKTLFALSSEEKEAVNINKLTNLGSPSSSSATVNADGTMATTTANSSSANELVFGRGYLSFGSESGLATIFEPKEGYSYGYPLPLPDQDLDESELDDEEQQDNKKKLVKRNLLNSPNIWPKTFPKESQRSLEHFYLHFVEVASHIARYLIRFHNTMIIMEERSNEGKMKHQQKKSGMKKIEIDIDGGEYISLMRLFHYFAKQSTIVQEYETNTATANVKKEALGSSPHTDWGLLTVILQNEVTGLQYMYKGEWKDVPYIPGSLIINIGDYFALSSHGKYHSPIHRVLCPIEQDRTSFVLFFYPDYDSKMVHVESNNGEEAASRENAEKLSSSEQQQQEEENRISGFNTLTRGVVNGADDRFGEYIVKKWKDVFRANMKY